VGSWEKVEKKLGADIPDAQFDQLKKRTLNQRV
jgi:hypothetical protein